MKHKSLYFLTGVIFTATMSGAVLVFGNGVSSNTPLGGISQGSINQTLAPAPTTNPLPTTLGTLGASSMLTDSLPAHKDTPIPAVQRCQIIHWLGNRVYTIKGSLNMGTHIVFPEPAVDVVVGNKDLWWKENHLNHVFVKPTTAEPDGAESTLSYIGESNTSYEFILERVPDNQATPCVIVTRDGRMMNDAAWSNYQNRDKQVIKLLVSQFEQEKKQIISQQQNALDKYRGMIYTGYSWQSTGWFGRNFISDVYDDGRWTYIRVNNDNRGVMAIYGTLDGKKNVLQFAYDETNKIYRVSGIYPKLTLAYGKNTVVITRKAA